MSRTLGAPHKNLETAFILERLAVRLLADETLQQHLVFKGGFTGLKKRDLTDTEPSFSHLGPWHANLIHIDRRKCVLFVNDKTLFNFIAPDVSRSQIRELGNLFRSYLQAVAANEGLSPAEQRNIQAEYREVGFAKSNSKSVLGSMNDLAFHYKYSIIEAGGVHSPLVPSIIKQLNRMPMSAIQYRFSIEAMKVLYEPTT